MRLSVLVMLVLLCGVANVSAKTSKPGWIADPKTGCRVWNGLPQPNETIIWTGNCIDKIAQGKGILRWFENGKPDEVDDGELRDGKLFGPVKIKWANGDHFDGEVHDKGYEGHGIFVYGEAYSAFSAGDRYEGEFHENNFLLTHLPQWSGFGT